MIKVINISTYLTQLIFDQVAVLSDMFMAVFCNPVTFTLW